MSETKPTSIQQSAPSDDVYIVDVMALLRALWTRAWLIVAVALIFGSAGYGVTKLAITPTYRTYFSIYINNSTLTGLTDVSSSDITASKYLAETGADIISSNSIKKEVAEQTGVEAAEIGISTRVNSDSGVLTVYVVTTDAESTYDCGAALLEVSSVEIARIIEGSSVQVIDTPELPDTYYRPNYIKNALIAMAVGVVLICGIIIVRELLDDKVKNRDDFEGRFPLVNLGSIPDITEAERRKNGYAAGYGYGAGGNKRQE